MYFHPIVAGDLDAIVDADLSWDALRGRTVLVTGVNGMIAGYLVLALLRANDRLGLGLRVVALARNAAKARDRYADVIDRPDLVLHAQDLADPLELDEPVHLIVHAASQTGPSQFTGDPVGTIDSNVLGTRNLLQWAVDHGAAQFLFLSTREIYGAPVGDARFAAEDDYGPVDPTSVRSCYPESKRLGEAYCVAFRHQFGLDARIARIAHTYGPGMVVGDGRVVGDFLARTVAGENIEMISDGSGQLALTYIADVIAGLLRLVLDTDLVVANISQDAELVSVRELAEQLTALSANPDARAVFAEASEQVKAGYLARPPAFLDSARMRAAGWSATVPMAAGLARVLAFLREPLASTAAVDPALRR